MPLWLILLLGIVGVFAVWFAVGLLLSARFMRLLQSGPGEQGAK